MTNKTATATAALVAAVPAAALGYFLVNTFLTGLGRTPTAFLGLYGATLAACVAVVFLPFAVLIFGAKSPARKPAADGGKSAAPEKDTEKDSGKDSEMGEAEVPESFEESPPGMESEIVEEPADKPISTGELEVVEPSPSEEALESFDGFDDSVPETEAFGADDDDFKFDDENEPPKKKKK